MLYFVELLADVSKSYKKQNSDFQDNSWRSLFTWCRKRDLNPHAPKSSGFWVL